MSCLEDTVALSVKDSDSWHSYQDSIIDEVLYRIKCFIASHAAYVQILVEVGFMCSQWSFWFPY